MPVNGYGGFGIDALSKRVLRLDFAGVPKRRVGFCVERKVKSEVFWGIVDGEHKGGKGTRKQMPNRPG